MNDTYRWGTTLSGRAAHVIKLGPTCATIARNFGATVSESVLASSPAVVGSVTTIAVAINLVH